LIRSEVTAAFIVAMIIN